MKYWFKNVADNIYIYPKSAPRNLILQIRTSDCNSAYYDNIEDDYLLSKIDLAKKVKKFLLFIAILFLVYFFYQSYTTYQALNLIKDQQIIYEKQGTIEETK